jgi:hypothetical protein
MWRAAVGGQLDDSLFSTSAKKGRQTGDENGCVCEEDPNHRGFLNDFADEVEPDSARHLRIGCSVGLGDTGVSLSAGRILRTHRSIECLIPTDGLPLSCRTLSDSRSGEARDSTGTRQIVSHTYQDER